MKKNLLFNSNKLRATFLMLTFVISLILSGQSKAQSISNYSGLGSGTFTAASGTFTSISTSGTQITFVNGDDANFGQVPFGFTFVYMGVPYTACFVNTNGYLTLASGPPSSAFYNGGLNTSTVTNFHPAICAYLQDLLGVSNTAYYQTSGAAGSRVFTYELRNLRFWYSGIPDNTPPSLSLQIKLYESTGKIEFVYDRLSGTQSALTSIGLTSSATQYLGLSDTSSSPTPSTSASITTVAGRPVSGQIYRFEPPTNIGSGMSFGSFTSIKTNSLSFNWSHTTPGNTVGYIIEQSSNSGSTYTTLGTVFTTSYTALGLNPATAYLFRITPVTEGFNGTSSSIVSSSQSTASCSGFTGTLQIGPSGNFASIKSAIDSLKNVGFNGNLVLELQSSYSSSGETFPIIIPDFRNNLCNATNSRLTIRPASGASNLIISGNNTTALFILDNAYKFTFDGRPGGVGTSGQLSFNNTSTAGTVFTLQNDAIGNTIKYCNIRSANSSSASGAIFIGGTVKFFGNDSNIISNNIITKSQGLTLASGITSTGTANVLLQNDANSILNNEIHSWTTFGVNVSASVGNGSFWNISGNSLYDSSVSTSTSMDAIYFIPGTTSNSVGNIISGNYIGGTSANAAGTPWTSNAASGSFRGISITTNPGTPTLIQNNVIQNISFNNTASTTLFSGILPTGGSVVIGGAPGKGNTVGHISTAKSISTLGNNVMIGINSSSAADVVISYNTIANIYQNNAGSSGAVRGIVNTSSASIIISNNTVKSLSTNSTNSATTTSSSVIGIISSSSSSNQSITDNIVGGGYSEPLINYSTTSLPGIIAIGNTSGITQIKRNKINGVVLNAPNAATGSSASILGIYNTGTAGGVIEGNEIRNLLATDTTKATQINGIYVAVATDINNNIISGVTCAGNNTGTGSTAVLTGISYQSASPATIKNNTIENLLAPTTASTEIVGITAASSLTYIQNNVIRNLASRSTSTSTTLASIVGIAVTPASVNKNVTGNKIYNLFNYNNSTFATTITGIYMTNTTSFGNSSVVNNNFIHSFKLATTGAGNMTGIYAASGIVTYQNNMIRLGIDSTGSSITGPYNIKGIVYASSSSGNYYNNSIYLAGSSSGTTNTACIEFLSTITTTETVNLKNNIFYNNISNSNTGRNAAIRMSVSNGRIFSNNNILYTPNTGGAAGIIGTTPYTSITGSGGWNVTTLMDGQSASVDPGFKMSNGTSSTVDLHLNSSNPAEGAGDPTVSIVTDDFDGELRASLSPNDIGADAGSFTNSSDLFPPIINLIPLTNTNSTGNRTFTVNIIDNGSGLPFSSANAPRVYYKKGSGTVYSGAGILSSGNRKNGNWDFTINATTLGGVTPADVISYYIIAQDSAGNVVSNAMYAVASNVNSVSTHPTTQNTYTIVTALATTIQVGTGQTYTALTTTTGLFNAINTSGLQGNTIVEITSDLTETGAVALNQWVESGGSNYTLTIRPSAASRRAVSGVGNGGGGMIRLNGADRVLITGIPAGGSATDTFLFIKTTGTGDPSITLLNDAINNTIQNCVIEDSPSASPSNASAIFLSATGITTGNDNNTIIRCYIRAINGTGLTNGIQSLGQLPTSILPQLMNDNITIRECHIYNFTSFGITVASNSGGNNWRILNNHFYRTPSVAAASAQTAINFVPGIISNNDTISGNFIGGTAPNCSGAAYTISSMSLFNGILVSAGTESFTQIQNNTIKNILFSGTGTLTTLFNGISITGGNADVGGGTGNTIGDLSSSNSIQTNGDAGLVGINSSTAFKLNVNNNTIANLTATGGTIYTSTSVRGITISSGTLTLNVTNNTIKNLSATSRLTTGTTTAGVLGISVSSSGNIQNILNNKVQNLKNLDNIALHCMVGIVTTSGLNIIRGNTISGLVSGTAQTTSNSTSTGIIGLLATSNLSGSELSNNSISDLQYTSSTPTTVQMIGLFVPTGSGYKINNNSITSLNSVSTSTGTTTSSAIIGLSSPGNGSNIVISGNTIHSLNHNNSSTANAVSVIGLYFSTNSSPFSTGTVFNIVSRNLIHSIKLSTTGAGSMYGIYAAGTAGVNSSPPTGAGGWSLFENNMIRLGIDSSGNGFSGPYSVYGIYQSYKNAPCMYYHNSIYIGGSPSSGTSITAALSIPTAYSTFWSAAIPAATPNTNSSTQVIIKNNILVNAISNTGSGSGKNYALKLGSSDYIVSNYNILYSNGTGGYPVGTAVDYANLKGASSWQLASGLDLNSGSGDPGFINATGKALAVDLRLSSSNPAEGNGATDVSTTVDFDGNIRSSRTPVDIGANSGNFILSSDIISPSISFNPLLNSSSTAGTKTLSNVSITDNVGIPMTGSSIPRIYFSKNATTWYSSSATTLTGTAKNAVASFDINYSTLGGVSQGDTIRYYIIAQDNAGNIMSNALYAVASDVNTITSHPIVPNSYKIVPSLAAGTKLRVGTGKTFPTLTGSGGLFEYLNSVALSGNVTAVISSNTIEPGIIVLNQLGDNGNGTYTVTIRPDSLTTSERLLTGNNGFGLIRLDGADRIKFTGVPDFNGSSTDKKLRFRNSSLLGSTFIFINEAVDNRLHNLNIESANTSVTQGTAGSIIFGTSTKLKGNSRDTVSNSVLTNDQTGILPFSIPAVVIHSFGDAGKENTANVIMGNEISNYSQYGTWLGNVGTGNNWSITSNSYYWNLPFSAYTIQYGIFADAQIFSGGHTISNNFIGGSAKNCGGTPWVTNVNDRLRGISVTSLSADLPTNITNNVIQNIRLTNIASPNAFMGIAIITTGNFNILNNLIGHPTNINSIVVSGAGQSAGILTQSSTGCNIRGNMIQGINLNTPGVASSFLGISLFTYGSNKVAGNTIGSSTQSNSIQYAGSSSFSAISSTVNLAAASSVLIDSNTIANITATWPETNVQLRGIYCSGTTEGIVTNNKIFNLSSNSSQISIAPSTATTSAITGIAYAGSSMGGTISNNTMYNLKAVNIGAVATCATGIGISAANDLMISNNRIYDIWNLSTNTNVAAPATVVGINISSPQNVVTMQNNQISLGTGQSNSPMFIGIWQSASGNFIVNSYFNSVYIGGTASSGIHSSYSYLRGNNFVTSGFTSVVNAKNNIFINDRKGGTGKHYAIGNQNIITTFQTGWQPNASNYNLLSNSPNYPLGLWNISDYSFGDWKSNSANDLSSVYMPTGTSGGQLNPSNLFQNISAGNLSLIKTNAEALNVQGKAMLISGITKDFDNLTRSSSSPTIGSSEAYLNDVGVSAITSINNTCGKAATTVTVTLKNYGLQSQSNIPVKLVGTGAGSFNFTETVAGPLAPNATISYTFTGTFNSVLGGIYNIKSYTNLSSDGVKTNDSSSIIFNIYPLPKPSFTYSDTCFGNGTAFSSTSTVTSGTIVSNSWKFGDGGTASGNTTSHIYTTAGSTYNVKITSTSSTGCTDSATKSISILSKLIGGVIGTDQAICFNTTPALLTNISDASGSLSPYNYQWQSSTDNVTFTDISGANGLTYQPGVLSVTMYYRRSVKTTSGCGPSLSNVVKITTNPILTAGAIGSPQTICYNGTGSAISFTTAPTGAFGTYTYQWQQSPDSATWSNISGQTGTTFTPTNVTVATFYRVLVFSGSCSSKGTNGVKIKLYSPITGGTIGSGQTICAGYTPAGFTQITAPSGGPGTYTFQWQSSTDSINWNNISGANSSGYSSPAVSGLTYFQRLAGSTGCPSGTSNAIKVRTLAKPNVVFSVANHCFNDPMPISNSSNISSGTLTYLWKFGDGGTSTSSVPNKTYSASGTYNVTLTATSNLGCKDSVTKSVIVATTPLPSFTFAPKCQGDSVIFTDNTVYACGAGSGLTFRWEFGDGTNSNVQHARHHYNSAGTYNVKFKISLPGGFKDSVTKTVVFNIRSTPSFSATNDCYPAATTFTNNSTNYSSLSWSFGDGSTGSSTSSSFTKTYSVAGAYNAKLVLTSSFGCKDSITKTVNVFNKPKAAFSASNVCIGFVTNFSNSSSGAVSYLWNFGDGRTSSSINPSNTYASAGTYNVKLKVTSSNGCVDSIINAITIYPNPVSDFTTTNVCNGFVSSFTNASTGASSYLWNFGNGNTSTSSNPTYTYPTPGNYTVTLTAKTSNGCSQSVSKSYTVYSKPSASFSGANVCLGNSITFNNSSTGATTNSWNFGDASTSSATSPTKTYSSSGNFNVKLVVTNTFGCKDSVTKSVTIFAKPIPAFTASNQCLGTAVNFTNQSTGAVSNVWVFGDGKSSAANSPNYTYAAAGSYTVKLLVTSANSCIDSISKTITVYSRPVVSFTASPDPICRGGLMSFTNTTTNGASYNWTFGNGSTSTATSPSNIYNTHGNYNVKLVSTSTNGCKDSAYKTVTVWPRPVASFKVNDGCATDNLAFASNSVGAVSHEWTFGDGNTSTTANPSKGYASPGTYNIKLIVTSVNGCKDTTNSSVTVFPRASVSFTNSTNFCVGLSAAFTNTTSLSSGTMTHQWSFGDGNTSSNTNPTYTYGQAGNYTVKLTTTTDKGCINTNTSSVIVFAKPGANFNAASVCAGGTVTFNNTTTGGTSYAWDFGDAGTSTLASPTHTYSIAGTYTVKLTATNANNCTDVITRQLVIFANPVANFTVTDRCIGQSLSFVNSSTGANDVLWQFGDGNSSNSYNPTFTYNASGTFNVTLSIKSLNGCQASVTKAVNVFAGPKAAFSINDNGQCINSNTFIYTDNSTISGGTYTRAWALGDGSTSTNTNPSKTYAASGNYNVKLVITSSNGCKDSAMNPVMVYPKPTANFTINNAAQCINGNLFSFSDVSSIGQGSISRLWNLGDGSMISGSNAIKKYSIGGTYTIRLTVESDFGCVDSIAKTVTVYASPTASFTFNNAIQCLNGNSFSFTNTTTGAASFNSNWNLGDGFTLATTDASRTYSAAGTYTVKLNVVTPFGCKDSAYYDMKVLPNPAALSISGPNTAPNGSVQVYSVPATPGSSYNWVATNGVVLSNGASTIQVKWNKTGITGAVSVTENAANGCQGNPANYNVSLTPAGVSQVMRNAFAASLYPNPNQNRFTVEVSTGEIVTMSVYDQLGREVMGGIRFSSAITLSDHNLAAGIYTVKLATDAGKTTIIRFEVKN